MSYPYDYLVFIGRFQPLHNGHVHVIREALRQAKHVIVLIGSANSSRRPRNPFTYQERFNMVAQTFAKELHEDRILIGPLNDYPYNEHRWIKGVQDRVNEAVGNTQYQISHRTKIGIIGYSKDSTSFYLKEFPQWNLVEVQPINVMNATDIRNEYLKVFFRVPETYHVPPPVKTFMETFATEHAHFQWLVQYHKECEHYKEIWKVAPFPEIIDCADNVVIQSGHVLLVTRKSMPGKGLLALPGGHVNPNETFIDAAVRELREETNIADERGEIPHAVLKSKIEKHQWFDDPQRSERGRVVTMAYLYNLPMDKLYTVKGGDDAASAKWYPLGSLKPEEFFEDHAHILDEMVGGL